MRDLYRDHRSYSRHVSFGRKRYGFWAFMLDVFMTLLTSGLWLIWVFVREMRGQR